MPRKSFFFTKIKPSKFAGFDFWLQTLPSNFQVSKLRIQTKRRLIRSFIQSAFVYFKLSRVISFTFTQLRKFCQIFEIWKVKSVKANCCNYFTFHSCCCCLKSPPKIRRFDSKIHRFFPQSTKLSQFCRHLSKIPEKFCQIVEAKFRN